MAGEDFVHVKLSAAGKKMAGEAGVLRLVVGRGHFLFKGDEVLRVTRAYEWEVLLKDETFQGEPMFELAEQPAADHPVMESLKEKV